MKSTLLTTMLAMGFLAGCLSGQTGTDVNQAIPIYFGQEVGETIDAQLKPMQVYSINLAQGQTLSIAATLPTPKTWCIGIYAPTTRTLADLPRQGCNVTPLVYSGVLNGNNTGLSFDYQVPTAGRYFIAVVAGTSSVTYKLQVTARGTIINVPNPPVAGCVTGRVDSITYSLQLIAAGLADEAVIGGTKICASCSVKQPLCPEIVNRLENAMRSRVNVEACYDQAGSIFQIKLVQP